MVRSELEGEEEGEKGLAALADCPNVVIKISELGLPHGKWDVPSNIRVVREDQAGGQRVRGFTVTGVLASNGSVVSLDAGASVGRADCEAAFDQLDSQIWPTLATAWKDEDPLRSVVAAARALAARCGAVTLPRWQIGLWPASSMRCRSSATT